VEEPVDRALDGAVLGVATDVLHRAPVYVPEEGEVPDDVEQVRWPEGAGDERLLAGEGFSLLLASRDDTVGPCSSPAVTTIPDALEGMPALRPRGARARPSRSNASS
jgi:hypothetical protein